MTRKTANTIMWVLLIFTIISLSCFSYGIYVIADYIPLWFSDILSWLS